MAVIQCKMCGGDIERNEVKTVGICESCGSTVTLPKASDERRTARFNRGNYFRRQGDFDKALAVYESLVREDETDAEAHWCCALCRFGIIYVEDPHTYEFDPACYRACFDSFTEDADYLAALKYSDGITQRQYRKEAAKITEIQRGILAISRNEAPYDVFICCKETDDKTKERTCDSQDALEIYYQLTRAGYRVFYARITLADKGGAAQEPYIFAALNSARVMVVIGSKSDYFNAVWVKNEWSRFFELMRRDRAKRLLPCCRGVDSVEMPEQLDFFQTYDMEKSGFMQELIGDIHKLFGREEPKQTVTKTDAGQSDNADAAVLLRNGRLALEEGEWNRAGYCFNRVLNSDAECADAYVGLLMAELHTHRRSDLADRALPFDGSDYFKKAVRCGDAKTKAELNGYIAHINERNRNVIYDGAVRAMQAAKTKEAFQEAARKFQTIPGWRDADFLAEQCLKKAETARADRTERIGAALDKAPRKVNDAKPDAVRKEDARAPKTIASPKAEDRRRGQYPENSEESRKDEIYYRAANAMREANSEETYRSAVKLFRTVYGWRDANALAEQCFERAEEYRKEKIYNRATYTMQNAIRKSAFQSAADLFASIPGWRDADHQAEICMQTISEWTEKEEAERLEAGERAGRKKTRKRILKRVLLIATPVVALSLVFLIVFNTVIRPSMEIGRAKESAEQKQYRAAASILMAAGLTNETKQKYIEYSRNRIAGGVWHTVGLQSDGTVVAVGNNEYGQCNVNDWKDIVSISAGLYHTAGLKSDGTVVAVGYNDAGQCDVKNWKDIVAVSAGGWHTVGLKTDGTVVAVGYNDAGQCDVKNWKDIVAVSAGYDHTVGLKSDGTVVAVGYNVYGQCNVKDWKNIVAVSAGDDQTVGLKSDGTVVAVGKNSDGQCDVKDWKDIVAVSTGDDQTVGLKSDGTVVAVGDYEYGQCDVSDWKLW